MTQWPFHLPLMAITSAIGFLPTLVGYSIYHLALTSATHQLQHVYWVGMTSATHKNMAITSATLLNNTGYTMCLVVVKHLPHTTWQ